MFSKQVSVYKIIFFIFMAIASLSSQVGSLNEKINLGRDARAEIYDPITDTGDNAHGFAWNSNYGWISFNSSDCDPDCDGAGGLCTSEGTVPGCPAAGTIFHDYGVKIDLITGAFSGYAWSSNLGWISFNRIETGNPPEDDISPTQTGAIAQLDSGSSPAQVKGWANILSLGGNGWIKFSDSGGTQPFPVMFPFDEIPVADDPGITFPIIFPLEDIALVNSSFSTNIDISTGDFSGWAWNANDNSSGIGWISFNCNDAGAGGCSGTDYKVHAFLNRPPVAENMSSPNMSESNYCFNTVKQAILRWEFSDPDPGDSQSAFRIIFDNDNNYSDVGTTDHSSIDTGICDGSGGSLCQNGAIQLDGVETRQYPISPSFTFEDGTGLNYGQTYYWWVQVWDSYNATSGLLPGGSFTVPSHEYPKPDFVWSPAKPSVGEEIFASSLGLLFYYDLGDTAHSDCEENTDCSLVWSFPDSNGHFVPASNYISSTTIAVFDQKGISQKLRLTATYDSMSCSTTTDLSIKGRLPLWIEKK